MSDEDIPNRDVPLTERLGSLGMTKKHCYISFFMSGEYDLGRPQTVQDLKEGLLAIVADLPEDGSLEIAEFFTYNGRIYYTLKEGIPQ